MARLALLHPDQVRVLVCLEGSAARRHGWELTAALGLLLSSLPQLQLTVITRHWGPDAPLSLRRLLRVGRGRVRLLRSASAERRWQLLHEHDWLLLPQLWSDTGFQALQAVHAGCPVMCFDVSPLDECVRHGETGRLLPCELRTNWNEAPTARPLGLELLQQVALALQEPRKGLRPSESVRVELVRRRDGFLRFWNAAFAGNWA